MWIFGGRASRPAWCNILAIGLDATEVDIRAAYRRLALETHPDQGGSTVAMRELTTARDEALTAARERGNR